MHEDAIGQHLEMLRAKYLAIVTEYERKSGNIGSDHKLAGRQLLESAASSGNNAIVETLLAAGVDVNFNARGRYTGTLLEIALSRERKDMMGLLLANKADVNAKDKYGETVLHKAVDRSPLEIVELLLANNADVNVAGKSGRTALHIAVGRDRLDILELLLDKNADVNAKDKDGLTPLYYAIHMGHKALAKSLREGGAKTSLREKLLLAVEPIIGLAEWVATSVAEIAGWVSTSVVQLFQRFAWVLGRLGLGPFMLRLLRNVGESWRGPRVFSPSRTALLCVLLLPGIGYFWWHTFSWRISILLVDAFAAAITMLLRSLWRIGEERSYSAWAERARGASYLAGAFLVFGVFATVAQFSDGGKRDSYESAINDQAGVIDGWMSGFSEPQDCSALKRPGQLSGEYLKLAKGPYTTALNNSYFASASASVEGDGGFQDINIKGRSWSIYSPISYDGSGNSWYKRGDTAQYVVVINAYAQHTTRTPVKTWSHDPNTGVTSEGESTETTKAPSVAVYVVDRETKATLPARFFPSPSAGWTLSAESPVKSSATSMRGLRSWGSTSVSGCAETAQAGECRCPKHFHRVL
jgi:hypothetical protein